MQAVGGDEPPGAQPRAGDGHPVRLLPYAVHAQREDGHARVEDRPVQKGVQVGAADAEALPAAERCLDAAGSLHVADAGEGVAGGVQAEGGEGADGAGHQALAARLVDRGRTRFRDDGVEAGAGGVQRGGETRRSAADDEEVGASHAGTARVRAAFSQRTRTVSSTASASVNTVAVIHAECTRGRAAPSTTTAT